MPETARDGDVHALFLKNMRPLWRRDPTLALRVDAVHDDERFPTEPARSGARTVRMIASDGSPVYLHSRHDPVAEADRFAASVEMEDKYCFVVCGFGLGYHVRALFRRLHDEAFILCTEPSLELLATALSCVDLSDLIDSGRLIVLFDDDKGRLHERLRPFNALMMLGAQFVRHPPSMRVGESRHGDMTKMIADYAAFTHMSLVTLLANSRTTCRNIAMNLVNYVTTPPIDLLNGRFAGDPAIVVSAGPSLSRNIDQLSDWKGRAVLCAVQTALQPLMRRGIVPDFVTSLDFHEMSRKFFDGAGDLKETHLVAEPKATWHVIDGYPGPVSLLGNAWAQLVLGDELGARDGLLAGATVAHLAFYLSVYMGCDPVIFVGQDLAFTGHVFYVPGVEIHRAWRGEINRFQSMEQKEWERIARNRSILRKVPSADGGELYSDELLLTYLEQFEKDIAGVACRVVNATEGGARIRGAEHLSLREAAERFGRRMIEPAKFDYRRETEWRDPTRLPAAVQQIRLRIEELNEATRVCEELLDLLRELDGLTHDPTRFNRRMNRVDELRSRVSRESRAYHIINMVAQFAEFRRFRADRRIEAAASPDAERAKRQIARDIEFVSGVRDGAADVRVILDEAVRRMLEKIGDGR